MSHAPVSSNTMIMTADGKMVGGIVKKADTKAPEAWLGYVTVASVKRTIAKAKHRKAKVAVDYTKQSAHPRASERARFPGCGLPAAPCSHFNHLASET